MTANPTDPNALAVRLRPFVVLFTTAFVGYAVWVYSHTSTELLVGGLAVTAAALFPLLWWTIRALPGLPLFPGFAASFLQFSALPLLTNHPAVAVHSPDVQFRSALTVAGFLVVATVAWALTGGRASVPEGSSRVFRGGGVWNLLTVLLLGVLGFNLLLTAGLLPDFDAYHSLLRHSLNAAGHVALYVLWHAIGTRALSPGHRAVVAALTVSYLVWVTTGLILAHTLGTIAVCASAFTIGRGRVPILSLVTAAAVLALLHAGKFEMRQRYRGAALAPSDYPQFYAAWVDHSLNEFGLNGTGVYREKTVSSASDRAGIIHMMMIAQSKTPDVVPHLGGETYAPLPALVVPRVLNPRKPSAHIGTNTLSVRYGLQTVEQTHTTTIGWSLESEAFANFGYVGVGVLGVIVGSVLGQLTRLAGNGSTLTLTQCAALMTVNLLLNGASSAGTFVSSLSQSLFALYAIGLLITQKEPTGPVDTNPSAAPAAR